jgi:hypothetical protein
VLDCDTEDDLTRHIDANRLPLPSNMKNGRLVARIQGVDIEPLEDEDDISSDGHSLSREFREDKTRTDNSSSSVRWSRGRSFVGQETRTVETLLSSMTCRSCFKAGCGIIFAVLVPCCF